MARQKRVFSPEFREDAVKLVIDTSRPMPRSHENSVSVRELSAIGWRRIGAITPGRSHRWMSVTGPGCGRWNGSCGR